MLRNAHKSLAALLVSLMVANGACGGAQRRTGSGKRPIDRARAMAEKHPHDRGHLLELALGEHLYDGGEPERARRALTAAKPLAGDDLRFTFVEAEQNILEGEPKLALASYLALLERTPKSADALKAKLAEATLQSLGDMNDVTDDYRVRVHETLAKLRPNADALGPEAAHQLRMALLAQALQRSDLDDAEALAREAGCVQRAEIAGPFGPRDLLGFDRVMAAETAGPLAAEYDLGPGRGVRPTRVVETRRCVIGVGRGAHDPLAGSSILRAEIETNGTPQALRIESPNSFVLWIDGKEQLRVDLRTRYQTGARYVALDLPKGKHELKLKIASRHPNPVLSLAVVAATPTVVEQLAIRAPSDDFERYLFSRIALGRGDLVGARELLRKLGQKEPTAHWLVLEAASALSDPLKTPELRRDRARELLEQAQKQNPSAWYPSVGIARLAAAEGRSKEAIEGLRSAVARWPNATAVQTVLIEQLRAGGFVEEADQLIARLKEQMPNACAVLNLALQAARSRNHTADTALLTDRVMQCDATSIARLTLLKSQRKYQEAATELARLATLGEPPDPALALETELERARLLGDEEKERTLRDRRAAIWSDRPEPVLERTDALLARGDKQKATSYLDDALAKNPGDLYELRRVHDALSPDELFKGYRKRTDDVIRAFEAGKPDYDGPQVLVLDYTVVRLFEDGSSVELTHNIMKMQSQEAVDQNGEFSVPDGARLLSLHTIKPDGTRIEPDAIQGKSSWSLPNLAPGDYVEFEYVRGEAPSLGFPGGYLGDRFYFKSFEVPFDHSELTLVMPATMEPVLDPRGALPETVREKRGNETVLRWTAKKSVALTPEPGSVAQREYVPSIAVGVKVGWEAYIESLRDLLADKDVYDPAAQEFVLELLGPLVNAPASARAQALHRWVTDQIEATEDVFGPAAAMLGARTGNRERVLKYMLSLAGIESELVIARGAEADHSEAKLPDPETYGHLLLRVRTESGPVFTHAGARQSPFTLLPPGVRGEQAMVVNERAERTVIPPGDPEADLRSIVVDVALYASGKGELHVRETHRGMGAVQWRNDLESIPAAELSARFEQSYLANTIPGGRLDDLTIEGRGAPDAPLVLDYRATVDDLGQRTGDQLRVGTLFPAMMAARYARQGVRTTTQLVAPAQASDVQLRIRLPKGARVLSLPKAGSLRGEQGVRFTAQAERAEQQVVLTHSLRLPIMRIAPDAYPSFASLCRGVDALEASDLVLELAEDD